MKANDRNARLTSVSICCGFICAISALVYVSSEPEIRFEELALGTENTTFYANADSYPVHITSSSQIGKLLEGWNLRKERPVVLWLGNSQLHAINQAKKGDETASSIVFKAFNQQSLDVLTFSVPNANLQEHLTIFEFLKSKLPLKAVVLPVVFDDFRETDIRADLVSFLEEPHVREAFERTPVGRQLLNLSTPDVSVSEPEQSGSSLQDRSERGLERTLEQYSKIFAARSQIRARIFASLYELRNIAFGITAQTIRRRIVPRYDKNWQALIAIVESAKISNLPIFLYIAPLRTDVAAPYDINDYQSFKDQVATLGRYDNVIVADLDTIVPGEFWGTMADLQGNGEGLDFMHFQAGGHALLSKAVIDGINRLKVPAE